MQPLRHSSCLVHPDQIISDTHLLVLGKTGDINVYIVACG